MRNRFILLTLVFLVALGLLVRPSHEVFYLGGIQVNEPDHAHWIERLEDSGMNTVAVTVYAKQGDWDSANLWWEEEEPWVLAEARSAKQAGLRVVLVLRVALDHAFERNKFFWHGMIMPRSDAQLYEWFERYRRFALDWARVAEEEGIDVLAFASELNGLTSTVRLDQLPVLEEYWSNAEKVERQHELVLRHDESIDLRHLSVRGFDNSTSLEQHLDDEARAHAEWARQVGFLDDEDHLEHINTRRQRLESHWLRLVEEIRGVYSGELTYAANFDQYELVTFWGVLDSIAINAYFPLRKQYQPGITPEELYPVFEARWQAILRSIRQLSLDNGWGEKPILFTELGYVYRSNSTIEPWATSGFSVLPSVDGEKLVIWEDEPIDLAERAMAVRALRQANRLLGEPLEGILYWKLSTQPYHFDDEPFVLIIHEDAYDPLLEELQAFGRWSPWDEAKRRLASISDYGY